MVANTHLLVRLAQSTSDANAVFRETVCGESATPWEQMDNDERRQVVTTIAAALEARYDSAEASHTAWLERKRKDGWSFGETEDREKKITPYLTEWAELPMQGRAKAALFVSILKPFYGQ